MIFTQQKNSVDDFHVVNRKEMQRYRSEKGTKEKKKKEKKQKEECVWTLEKKGRDGEDDDGL